jgi:hypothetical protein
MLLTRPIPRGISGPGSGCRVIDARRAGIGMRFAAALGLGGDRNVRPKLHYSLSFGFFKNFVALTPPNIV